ncbi:hypothetical protein PR048_025262 [Dryococelus australis]|uniref:CHK kinase-like domain-containing protein n=1 Tax=Dryococelus australis TaxID=614101 RepID=A0ABQ9GQW5_9NEOP|nr:hypothetical protein PR048_025262 [Dryococelus australis]
MAEIPNNLTKKNLEELLKSTLDAEGNNIEDFSVRYLTKPGDNYGSTMLAVDVTLTPDSRTLPLVAKMPHKKEIDVYLLVRPAFERIQKENDVPEDKYLDVLPMCYGTRISSEGDSGPVDETSVILQENLKTQGFECGDRFIGLNLAHCRLVVDKLARFHATAVAMKIKNPEEFKKTVFRAANPVVFDDLDIISVKPLENIPEYEATKERIDVAMLKSWKLYIASPKPPKEPFATITHLDLWTNNIMFQYGSSSCKNNPKSLRFVDFQGTRYDSPARDLLFFLYSSAELQVLSEQYDDLVRLYHDSFVDCLRILKCDTSPFSFAEFMKEIERSASLEIMHLAFMLPLYLSLAREDAIGTADITHEHFKNPPKFGKTYLARARKFMLDFACRNWI